MARRWLVIGVVVAAALAWSNVEATIIEDSPYVEIWTDRGQGSIYREGEGVEIFIRPDYDCYVMVYEIDTDGYLRLLFPSDCYGNGYVYGGHTYRLGRDAHRRFYVRGPQGVEYIHVLASFEPFRQVYWHGCRGYEDFAYDVTWRGFSDYWGCALPPRVYGDPYMAMQSIDEFICADALDAGIVWADFTYFYVHDRVPYPRYVCYDCHGFGTYVRPYTSVCTGFSITFVDCDPCFHPWSWWWWCAPKRVYCGPRYVCYCKKPCKDYPSEYKWKSRSDLNPTRYAVGREPVKVKSGNISGTTGVKSKNTRTDLDLYSRREPRGEQYEARSSGRPDRAPVERVTSEVKRATAGDHERRSIDRAEIQKAKSHPERSSRSDDGQSVNIKREPKKTTTLERIVSSLRKVGRKQTNEPSGVRQSTKSSDKSSNKVAPKVRTDNQGRSPETRRRVSR